MHGDTRTRRLLAAGLLVAILAGCAAYSTPYGEDKVEICHKNGKTLLLPQSAVAAHLEHGDLRGPCESGY